MKTLTRNNIESLGHAILAFKGNELDAHLLMKAFMGSTLVNAAT
jgi:hypothetical protein